MRSTSKEFLEPCNLLAANRRKSFGFEPGMFTVESFRGEQTIPEIIGSENPKPKGWMRYVGIFFAILASIVFSLSSVVVKAIQQYEAFNLGTWRFQGALVPCIVILCYYWVTGNKDVFKNVLPLSHPGAKKNLLILFLRGLIAGGAVVAQIYSLQYLDIADSTVICFSSPVFVTFLAHFMLGEALGFVPIITSIITLGGVVIVARPPILGGEELSEKHLIGIGMAVTSMLFSTAVLIVLRFLKDVNPTLAMTSFGSVGTLFCVILALSTDRFEWPQGKDDWIFAIALGALTFVGQIFFTLALQYEEAGPVALIRTGDVIFSFIWQYIFLGIKPDIFSIVGAIVVISGVVVVGARKWIASLPEMNQTRKRLWFLLL